MNKLYAEYKDRAAFYVVYIEEAHTTDLWQLPVNEAQGVVVATPKTDDERAGLASACVRNLQIDIPAVVDGLDNYRELMRLLVEEKSALKVFMNVAAE